MVSFITILRDQEKMLAGEGYCCTQVRSAVLTIESMNHKFLKMNEEEYKK